MHWHASSSAVFHTEAGRGCMQLTGPPFVLLLAYLGVLTHR